MLLLKQLQISKKCYLAYQLQYDDLRPHGKRFQLTLRRCTIVK